MKRGSFMLSDTPVQITGKSGAPAIFYLVLGIVLMCIIVILGKIIMRKKK